MVNINLPSAEFAPFAEQPFTPVIMGADIGTYSLARSFHEAYAVHSIALSRGLYHLCGDSSIITTLVRIDWDTADGFCERLLAVAQALPSSTRPILLACGDWYVELIAKNKKQLQDYFVVPYVDGSLHDALVYKNRFYDMCKTYGVAYPQTQVIDCARTTSVPVIDLQFPIVVKAASTPAYHYVSFEGQRKVFLFDRYQDFATIYQRLIAAGYTNELIVQEYIPGDDTHMNALTCYCDADGITRFACMGQTLLEDPRANGVGNPVAILGRNHPEVVECASRLLKGVGYHGFANFDIKYDGRDDTYKFFEINPRLGRSNYYVTANGCNPVTWIVRDFIENETFSGFIDGVDPARPGLFNLLPKHTLLSYVHDSVLKEEIEQAYVQHRAFNPIAYSAEKHLIRRLYPLLDEYRYAKTMKQESKGSALRSTRCE